MMRRLDRFSGATSLRFGAVTVLLAAFACVTIEESEDGGGDGPATGGGAGGAAGLGTGGAGATSGTGQGGVTSGGTGPTGGTSTGGSPATGGAVSGGTGGGITGGVSGTAGTPTGGAGAAGSPTGGAGGSGGSATGGGSGSGGAAGCMTPPAPSMLVGWATQGTGTTGGGNATPMVVTTAQQFTTAIAGNSAAVVHLNGNINGTFTVGSNKTIIGVCGATITGAVNMNGTTQNVIFRNLKVVGLNCTDSPQSCSGGEDAIGVNGGAHHIWFDHLDVSNGSDGNLDMTEGSDFITISWTKFSYSSMRSDPVSGADGHRFSNLIGGSDTDPADVGHLNITFHHNWWADNVNQRMPRTRRGNIHVFNNLYTPVGNLYCTNAGQDAKLLVERNIYIGVNRPLEVVANGNMRSVENVFMNTMGNTAASGTGFTPTYTYTAEPTAGLEAAIRAGVGPK
jgi:pectate lyase